MNGELERLFHLGLPVVDQVAKRLARRLPFIPLDDLVAMGRIALMDATRSFDPERAQFPHYASLRIRWGILDSVRRETHGRVGRQVRAVRASEHFADTSAVPADGEGDPAGELPTMEACQGRLRTLLGGHASALALGLVTPLHGPQAEPEDSPEERVARLELAETLSRAVAALPTRERALVERHYFQDEQFDAVAADLGISKSWASRLHTKALVSLQRALQSAARPTATKAALRAQAPRWRPTGDED